MKRETFFLKFVVICIGIIVLIIGILGLSRLANNSINPDYAHILYPILAGIYVSIIPFYIGLYKAFVLLSYIDKNIAFSEESVKSLRHVKYCSITISALYILIMPFTYLLAEKDDAPGIILFSMVPIFISIIIAVIVEVLEKLLREVINFKNES